MTTSRKIDETAKKKLKGRFDLLAGELPRWRKKSRYYHNLQTAYFRFLVPEGKTVLELGCGTGELLASLNPSRGVGIDFTSPILEKARETHKDNPALEFVLGDVEEFNFSEKFDFIILSDVIGHLFDIEETLNRMRGACRADTRVIISYYNFLWEPVLKLAEWLKLKMPQKPSNWLSPHDLKNILHLAGFETVKTEKRALCPKKIPIFSWLFNKIIASIPLFSPFCLTYYVVARPLKEENVWHDYSTSIVVPCRNEKGNIEQAVHRLPAFGKRQEIIFVDGHSTDGTQDEIKRVMEIHKNREIKFLIQDGKGKGDAVRKGFQQATGDILMILDADLTVPPEELYKFYRALVHHKGEFINGSRLVYPMEKQAMRFLNLLGNTFFSRVFSWLLNQRFKDTLCGTKVLFREDYQRLAENRSYFGDFDPFGDFDLIFGASKLNLKIVEIPIRYRERTYGTTNIQRFRHGFILLKMCLFAFRKLKMI